MAARKKNICTWCGSLKPRGRARKGRWWYVMDFEYCCKTHAQYASRALRGLVDGR